MKIKISLREIFTESDETQNINNVNNSSMPEIDVNRIKKMALSKIQQDKKRRTLLFRSRYTKAACVIAASLLITTGSVYAFTEDGFRNFICQLTGVQQTKILMVGEAISNKNYELKVHEIVTDSYVGNVVISIEALNDKSKEDFNNYRIDLNHIGSGFGLSELDEYREPYIKYYKISFSGATHKDSRNDGKLRFSVGGMKKSIEVSLSPTIERIDMDITGCNSNIYQYKFNKLHLSEIGLTLEGVDTKNAEGENWYNIELLFADGTKELLQKKMNENDIGNHTLGNVESSSSGVRSSDGSSISVSPNTATGTGKPITETSIDGDLFSGGSSYHSGDNSNFVNITISFSKALPLDTIKQVIINEVAYDVER